MLLGTQNLGKLAFGEITSSLNAAASGSTLIVSSSLISGVASSSIVVNGVILPTETTLIEGTASGDNVLDGDADGDLITLDVELIPGIAFGERLPTRIGGGVPFLGLRHGDAIAGGTTLQASITLTGGRASVVDWIEHDNDIAMAFALAMMNAKRTPPTVAVTVTRAPIPDWVFHPRSRPAKRRKLRPVP